MSVGLACNRKFKQGDDLKEDVLFIDVVAFGKIGETAAQYTDKGDSILVEGRLQQRRWETEAGEKRSKHEVIAERITFLKTKKNSQGSSEQPSPDDDTW
jgi:single-strand DNA-binding protein